MDVRDRKFSEKAVLFFVPGPGLIERVTQKPDGLREI